MSLSCARAQSLFSPAIDGEIDEGLRARLNGHLNRCAPCADGFDMQRRIGNAIAEGAAASPPPVYFEGVLAEIHAQMPATAGSARVREPMLDRQSLATAIVAALALIWFGSFMLGSSVGVPGRDGGPEGAAAPLAVAAARAAAQTIRASQTVVLVRGIGFVSAQSPILKMSPAMLMELGLTRGDLEITFGSRRALRISS